MPAAAEAASVAAVASSCLPACHRTRPTSTGSARPHDAGDDRQRRASAVRLTTGIRCRACGASRSRKNTQRDAGEHGDVTGMAVPLLGAPTVPSAICARW